MPNTNLMLFTPGPVNINPTTLELSSHDEPYFRNSSFSEWLNNLQELMLEILEIPPTYKVIFISGSGTAAMEMALRAVESSESLLSIETGIFSQRATSISQNLSHDISSLKLDLEELDENTVNRRILESDCDRNFSAVHYTYSETSTGALISPRIKSLFKRNGVLVIVDAVTALFTEMIDFSEIDIFYSASQKGISCHPGVGFLVLSPFAQQKILTIPDSNLYLNPKNYLKDNLRGQTPFTPSLSILSQIYLELLQIKNSSGYASRVSLVNERAISFRNFLMDFNIQPVTSRLANCVTNFLPPHGIDSKILISRLATESIYIAPNSPGFFPNHVRVAHFGHQTSLASDLLKSNLSSAFRATHA